MSGKTIALVALAVAYYLALNAVLINEIVEQVQVGPQPVAKRFSPPLTAPNPQDSPAPCAALAKKDRDICRADLLIGQASARLKERARQERLERRDRRAAREERRALQATPPLTGALHRESAAMAR